MHRMHGVHWTNGMCWRNRIHCMNSSRVLCYYVCMYVYIITVHKLIKIKYYTHKYTYIKLLDIELLRNTYLKHALTNILNLA